MHLSLFSYDGMIMLLSSFIKMMSMSARILSGSSSSLLASWMSSSETFSVTIFDIFIYINKESFSLCKVIRVISVGQGMQ